MDTAALLPLHRPQPCRGRPLDRCLPLHDPGSRRRAAAPPMRKPERHPGSADFSPPADDPAPPQPMPIAQRAIHRHRLLMRNEFRAPRGCRGCTRHWKPIPPPRQGRWSLATGFTPWVRATPSAEAPQGRRRAVSGSRPTSSPSAPAAATRRSQCRNGPPALLTLRPGWATSRPTRPTCPQRPRAMQRRGNRLIGSRSSSSVRPMRAGRKPCMARPAPLAGPRRRRREAA